MTHTQYMQQALDLAQRAAGKTSPNPMVGAVIVKAGRVIGEGLHRRCGTAHAEIVALKQAGARARGATMYVTLEPCFHHGRTGPCVEAILNAGIAQIFVAMKDPNPLVAGKSIRRMRREGMDVHVGLLKDKAQAMNDWFVKYITTGMPFVVAKTAQTLDGKIATASGHSQWITSAKTRRFTRQQRNLFDAIVVGIETVLKDNPQLTPASKKDSLSKVVVDSRARLPLDARLFDSGHEVMVAVTSKAPRARVQRLREKGAAVIECPTRRDRVDLRYLMKELARLEMARILIEGGGCLIGGALREGLVDVMNIYVAPKICGDAAAVSSIQGLVPKTIDQAVQLDVNAYHFLESDLLIEAMVKK